MEYPPRSDSRGISSETLIHKASSAWTLVFPVQMSYFGHRFAFESGSTNARSGRGELWKTTTRSFAASQR
ncbi:hypothetical protein BN2475_420020 [Paraburkholderia ribeironis]|uniref:Uncharacterized protein n=1 Tax=Paraburkholderia ribeironis TaxID=1247936 RepID=A0A1N7S747_9BURK|nr:hypothetical protein BN2475_420020 [Paraburkholderia ribeironis]